MIKTNEQQLSIRLAWKAYPACT